MHPNLQRKLIRLVQNRYPQVIIATHSIEIISEVDPGNIITINKKNIKMHYMTDLQAVQKV
ncbi:MAG: ATP-binding protein [Lachnospiraceae bacterium]|jgi:predicted ATP-dependent endonuclease of OLD family|nr:ATP-binding protein [Lachnospiraceae bacterium]